MNYTLVGGDPDQRNYVAEVLNNDRLPLLKWDMTIKITNLGSRYDGLANPWTIKLSDRLRPDSRYWRHVVYHEVGHVFDHHYLASDIREVVMKFMPDDDVAHGWHGVTVEPWNHRPKERFANEFDNFIRCREQDHVPRSLIGRMIYHADPSWGSRNSTVHWGCR